jgi:hypothetical protein
MFIKHSDNPLPTFQSACSTKLEAKLGYNGREVLVADGTYHAEGEGTMKVLATLKAFPLGVANAFIPDGMAKLSGALNGEVALEGSTQSPKINGGFKADTSSVYIPQAGARLRLDEKEIKVTDNKLVFDNYHIYAVGKNPLNISGSVDLKDLQQMRADLKLTANNYQLFNANRTKQSLVYGKLFVDLNTTIRGPVDALVMRGNMRLLGNGYIRSLSFWVLMLLPHLITIAYLVRRVVNRHLTVTLILRIVQSINSALRCGQE